MLRIKKNYLILHKIAKAITFEITFFIIEL